MKSLHLVTYTLMAVGALNWGLIGFFNYNLVASLLPSLANLIYMLVGLSAAYEVMMHSKMCKQCMGMMKK